MHVLFGAPGEQPDHAARAAACALELDQYAQAFRERWQQKGIDLGVTRIGAYSGPAIVGNFGGGRFFDYTAYGDTINVAARLETVNKQLGTRICVSGDLASRIDKFHGRPVGDLMLRGKTGGMRAVDAGATSGCCHRQLSQGIRVAGDQRRRRHHSLCVAYRQPSKRPVHLKRLLNGAKGAQLAMD